MEGRLIAEWCPSKITVAGQLDVNPDEIRRLGAEIVIVESGNGPAEFAVFELSNGVFTALVRIEGNPTPGFGLIASGVHEPAGVLAAFMRESGLPMTRVTWRPSDEDTQENGTTGDPPAS